jgi:hypothetical protein
LLAKKKIATFAPLFLMFNQKILSKMKTKLIYAAAFMAAVAVAACGSKDEDGDNGASPISGRITVKVDGGASLDIDSVNLELGRCAAYSAAYANGEFTLDFPSVDDKYLYSVTEGLPGDSVTVSNANVKVEDANLIAYKSGNEVGSFLYGTAEWKGFLMYANGDVNLTGTRASEGQTDIFNVKLKKGWNFVYSKDTETTYELTTQAPAGAAWRYEKRK